MKFKAYLMLAVCGLALSACRNNEPKNLSEISDASKGDSLVYCFAQMRGAEYFREAERDTTLATPDAKKAYLMGVQAGLNATKEDNEAYNRGLFLGMQMAMNFQQFKKDYDVKLNKKVFIESLSEALSADSLVNPVEMQREFYRIMGEFSNIKSERDSKAASEALSKAAAGMNLKSMGEQLYGAVTEKTEGERIKDGDNVDATITFAHADGKEIEAPIPSKFKVGARNLPTPVDDALKSLKSGETGKFVTSAMAIFGQRASQMGLEPADVIVMTIKATVAPAEEEAKK